MGFSATDSKSSHIRTVISCLVFAGVAFPSVANSRNEVSEFFVAAVLVSIAFLLEWYRQYRSNSIKPYVTLPVMCLSGWLIVHIGLRCAFDSQLLPDVLATYDANAVKSCYLPATNALSVLFVGIMVSWVVRNLDARRVYGLLIGVLVLFVVIVSTGLIEYISQLRSGGDLAGTEQPQNRISGSFGNRNLFASAIAAMLPLVLSLIWRCMATSRSVRILLVSVVIALLGLSLPMSGSRLGTIAAFVGAGFWLFFSIRLRGSGGKYGSGGLATTAGLGLMFVLTASLAGLVPLLNRFAQIPMDNSRFVLWEALRDLPNSYWIFGVGLGRFSEYFMLVAPRAQWKSVSYLHNDLLQFTVELGAISAVIVLVMMFWWIQVSRSKSMTWVQLGGFCSVVAVLTHSIGDFPLHSNAVMMLFFLSVGLMLNNSVGSGNGYHIASADRSDKRNHKGSKRRRRTQSVGKALG